MGVGSAGMHDAGVLRGEGGSRLFMDGQGVDVATQGDRRSTLLRARYARYDGGLGNAADVSHADFTQRRLELRGGAFFLERELRIAMDGLAQFDEACPEHVGNAQ